MSYHRSNYTSPSGAHSYSSNSYVSPSGNNRYSSKSSYDSYGSSGLGRSKYGSGLGSSYGGSLGSLTGSTGYSPRYSDYGSSSPYSSSSYTPGISSYNRTSKYDSAGSSYTPRSDYTSRYSRPTSSYDSDYSGTTKYRSSDIDTSSSRPARKTRFADEDYSPPKPTKQSADSSLSTKASRSDDSLSSKARQRRQRREEGSSPILSRSAVDADVSTITRKTEGLSVDNSSQQQRPYSPSFQEYGKQAAESARYQEQVTETPQYRPFTNPNLQSNSFKTLQTVIDSGGDPGSYFQTAPWQSATVNQVADEPRKYTPSKTWAAVHSDGRNGEAGPGSYPAPQSGPYQPSPAPTNRYQPPPPPPPSNPTNQYKPPSLYNAPKSAGGPKPFVPGGDGVPTKGTSAMNQQVANPDKIPVCAKCDTDIRGPFVLALNKSWCPNHFTCSKCESELVNMGFVELNGSVYCENDYENFFAPKCAKCRQAIIGDTVNALDKTWHPACFVCEECGDAISSGAFHVEEGRPYCMKDWQRLFQTKCTGCSYPVEPGDKWIEALGANWHSECFVCGVCKTQLEGKPFYPHDGKPFCKDHTTA